MKDVFSVLIPYNHPADLSKAVKYTMVPHKGGDFDENSNTLTTISKINKNLNLEEIRMIQRWKNMVDSFTRIKKAVWYLSHRFLPNLKFFYKKLFLFIKKLFKNYYLIHFIVFNKL